MLHMGNLGKLDFLSNSSKLPNGTFFISEHHNMKCKIHSLLQVTIGTTELIFKVKTKISKHLTKHLRVPTGQLQ